MNGEHDFDLRILFLGDNGVAVPFHARPDSIMTVLDGQEGRRRQGESRHFPEPLQERGSVKRFDNTAVRVGDENVGAVRGYFGGISKIGFQKGVQLLTLLLDPSKKRRGEDTAFVQDLG